MEKSLNPAQVISEWTPSSEMDPRKDFYRHRKDCDYLAIESRGCIYRMGDGLKAYGPLSKKTFAAKIRFLEKPRRTGRQLKVKII